MDRVLKEGNSSLINDVQEYCCNDVPIAVDVWAQLVQSRHVSDCQ